MRFLKRLLKRFLLLLPMGRRILIFLRNKKFPGSKEYWEKRYREGGTSGSGSYGKLGEFKAEVINSFIEEQGIKSVIDFGCGDGNQLSVFQLPACTTYIGLDVSKTAIRRCIERFKNDKNKSFFLYDPDCFFG